MGESAQPNSFYVSVKVNQEFDQVLRDFFGFEGCHVTEGVKYLLDPFLSVCEETAGFSLHAEVLTRPPFDAHIKVHVTEEFAARVDKQSEEYAMDPPDFSRIGLATTLRVHTEKVPKGDRIKKEVLKRFLVEDWRSRWDRR